MIRCVLFGALVIIWSGAIAAPPFRVASEDGTRWLSPGHFGGKPALLLFWDSRCPACIVELSNLSTLQRQLPDTALVSVALSSARESQRAQAQLKLPDAVVTARGPRSTEGLLAQLGNPSGALPFAAAFNATGKQCGAFAGGLTPDRIVMLRDRCK